MSPAKKIKFRDVAQHYSASAHLFRRRKHRGSPVPVAALFSRLFILIQLYDMPAAALDPGICTASRFAQVPNVNSITWASSLH